MTKLSKQEANARRAEFQEIQNEAHLAAVGFHRIVADATAAYAGSIQLRKDKMTAFAERLDAQLKERASMVASAAEVLDAEREKLLLEDDESDAWKARFYANIKMRLALTDV